ncbi:hypothetical protein [Rubrivirga sp. IMCC43871]|uniref:hypothetical protein n=1 Tax=Rubrivirga sp. IMCC43871 TaxID=3391575 RepID=UPI00398FAFE6
MTPVAVAGLSGRALRYAEVAPGPDGPRLRRLGAADFTLDVEAAVFETGDPEALQAVAEALAAGFGGAPLETLVVAAHPTATTSFFSRLPAALSDDARDGQLRQETALLADLAPTQAVRVRSRAVRTEGAHEWHHVVHVDEPVHDRLAALALAVGASGYDLADTTRAAASAAGGPGVALVVGAFATHTEVAVAVDGVFRFGSHGPSTAAADTAYFALAALQQAGVEPGDVARFLAYGDDARDERLDLAAEFVGRERTWLDPFALFARRPEADPAELAAFGPVVGAAL